LFFDHNPPNFKKDDIIQGRYLDRFMPHKEEDYSDILLAIDN
jgi:hypothetical protein